MMNQLLTLAQVGPDATFWMPPSRSVMAGQHDWAWNAVYLVMVTFFCIVVGAMTFFVIKYRRRSRTDKVSTVTHNTPLEIAWTAIPLAIVMWFFVVGFRGFVDYDTPPSDAYVIDVVAQSWSFQFTYPNGGQSDILYVPVNTKVRLNMTSRDATHAVYIPAFRISRNAIRGRTTTLWFEATQTTPDNPDDGYPLLCTQYCGDGHSNMHTRVVVLSKPDFEKKLLQLANIFKDGDNWLPYAAVGERIYRGNCIQCHTVSGAGSTGPTWKGLWKRDHQFSASDVPGFALSATDSDAKWTAYVTESLLSPEAKIVSGFQNVMPAVGKDFSGTVYKQEKLKAVIEYIKKVGLEDKYDPAGAPLYPDNPAAKKNTTTASEPATQLSPAGSKP